LLRRRLPALPLLAAARPAGRRARRPLAAGRGGAAPAAGHHARGGLRVRRLPAAHVPARVAGDRDRALRGSGPGLRRARLSRPCRDPRNRPRWLRRVRPGDRVDGARAPARSGRRAREAVFLDEARRLAGGVGAQRRLPRAPLVRRRLVPAAPAEPSLPLHAGDPAPDARARRLGGPEDRSPAESRRPDRQRRLRAAVPAPPPRALAAAGVLPVAGRAPEPGAAAAVLSLESPGPDRAPDRLGA